MTFEDTVRGKIRVATPGPERNVLKVVLGEYQQKAAYGAAGDETGHKIVERLIAGNRETLALLPGDDGRRPGLEAETAVLTTLLPAYLTVADVLRETTPIHAQIRTAKDGPATGIAVKFLKVLGLPVKGDTVREAVAAIRSQCG